MRRTLAKYERQWQRNAKVDPLFAILSSEDCKDGQWDVDEFFKTGRTEIDIVFRHLEQIGALPAAKGRFLDFGCGVGRVSRALSLRFPAGAGVDISSRMIALAKEYSKNDPVKTEYMVNKREDMSLIQSGSISFLYCHIVLQHMPDELQRRFIGEFCRVLEPGGIAMFQIPVGLIPREGEPVAKSQSWLRQTVPWLRRTVPQPIQDFIKKILGLKLVTKLEMNCLREEIINTIIKKGHCAVEKLEFSNSADPQNNQNEWNLEFFSREKAIQRILGGTASSHFLSAFYFIRKISGP